MSMHLVQVDPERVAAYIRWSTDEQSDGTALEVQREACRHYMLAQGWQPREELFFVDDGYSGGNLERPALSALRQAVRAGAVTGVVVFKLDRLSRSVIDTVNLVLGEWEGRCFVKSTREPVDTATPAGKMFFYMLASYAEWERSVIKERTLSGKVRRAQEGRNPGFTAPYGYRRGERPGELAVDEAEAAVVRRIFELYLAGNGLAVIAGMLNDLGLRPRRGVRWKPGPIGKLLGNPVYIGVLEYGKTAETPRHLREQLGAARVRFDRPRYAQVEGAHPPIISEKVFAEAQRIRQGKAAVVGKRALSAHYLLTGIARCRCGAPLRGDNRAGKKPCYRCVNSNLAARSGCRAGLVPAARLDALVVQAVKEAYDPCRREIYLGEWESEVGEARQKAEDTLEAVRKSLADVQRRRERLQRDYYAGDLSAKVYNRGTEALEAEEARLQACEAQAVQEVDQASRLRFNMAEFEAQAAKVDLWEHLTPAERKQLLRDVVASCVVWRQQGEPHRPNPNPVKLELTICKPSRVQAPVVRPRELAGVSS